MKARIIKILQAIILCMIIISCNAIRQNGIINAIESNNVCLKNEKNQNKTLKQKLFDENRLYNKQITKKQKLEAGKIYRLTDTDNKNEVEYFTLENNSLKEKFFSQPLQKLYNLFRKASNKLGGKLEIKNYIYGNEKDYWFFDKHKLITVNVTINQEKNTKQLKNIKIDTIDSDNEIENDINVTALVSTTNKENNEANNINSNEVNEFDFIKSYNLLKYNKDETKNKKQSTPIFTQETDEKEYENETDYFSDKQITNKENKRKQISWSNEEDFKDLNKILNNIIKIYINNNFTKATKYINKKNENNDKTDKQNINTTSSKHICYDPINNSLTISTNNNDKTSNKIQLNGEFAIGLKSYFDSANKTKHSRDHLPDLNKYLKFIKSNDKIKIFHLMYNGIDFIMLQNNTHLSIFDYLNPNHNMSISLDKKQTLSIDNKKNNLTNKNNSQGFKDIQNKILKQITFASNNNNNNNNNNKEDETSKIKFINKEEDKKKVSINYKNFSEEWIEAYKSDWKDSLNILDKFLNNNPNIDYNVLDKVIRNNYYFIDKYNEIYEAQFIKKDITNDNEQLNETLKKYIQKKLLDDHLKINPHNLSITEEEKLLSSALNYAKTVSSVILQVAITNIILKGKKVKEFDIKKSILTNLENNNIKISPKQKKLLEKYITTYNENKEILLNIKNEVKKLIIETNKEQKHNINTNKNTIKEKEKENIIIKEENNKIVVNVNNNTTKVNKKDQEVKTIKSIVVSSLDTLFQVKKKYKKYYKNNNKPFEEHISEKNAIILFKLLIKNSNKRGDLEARLKEDKYTINKTNKSFLAFTNQKKRFIYGILESILEGGAKVEQKKDELTRILKMAALEKGIDCN